MEGLFLSLWNRGAAAGWLILAILLLRLALQRAPKSVRPALWFLAAVRLVCPSFGESPLSLLPSAETVPRTVLARDAFQVTSGITAVNSVVNEGLVDYYETTKLAAGHTRRFLLACAVIWVIGMAALLLWALARWLGLRRQVAEAVPEGEGVWVCGAIGAPFLLGLLRPRIYLPVGLEGAERSYVLAHERAHIRRRDFLVKPLGFLLLAVYWFQPLVWVGYILLCRDVELACDEEVVARLGPESRKPYAEALLACGVRRSGLSACPLAFGEAGVKERVKNVLRYRKPALWVVMACAGAFVLLAVCFLTDPVERTPEPGTDFRNLGASQPEEPTEFAVGALLYQSMALSFQPVDGSYYAAVGYGGDTLTLTGSLSGLQAEPVTYALTDTVHMARDNLYDYFPDLREQEERLGVTLTEDNDLSICARFFRNEKDDPEARFSVWTVQKEGGGQRWWLYDGWRLYALLLPEETFPFLAGGVLWTYAPQQSEMIPVQFALEGGAEIYAGPGGRLSLDPRAGTWAEHLRVERDQTVYWKPALDGEGSPMANTGLRYCYDAALSDGSPYRVEEHLTLRPAMDYGGLYGGVTYGISNNWLGAASSQLHFSALGSSGDGGLVVTDARLREPGESVDSVRGRSDPAAVYDAPAESG